MPRMSRKRKQEWALFLNEKEIALPTTDFCRKCSSECKQSFSLCCGALPKIFIEKENKEL